MRGPSCFAAVSVNGLQPTYSPGLTGSLVIVNPVGAPRRLLELIETLERVRRAPQRDGPLPIAPAESVAS